MKRRTVLSALTATAMGALLEGSVTGSARGHTIAQASTPPPGQRRFETSEVEVPGNTVFVRRYGRGPAVLMVHGFPRTSLMWRFLAPGLAENRTVICADLRAYGGSGTPASTDDHLPYSKRAMAKELVDVMAALGFPTFALVGHDRGGRVAYRMALDHPKNVERVAVFDVIPILEGWDRADARFARTYWPWILLAQQAPLPESYLLGAPQAVFDNPFGHGPSGRKSWRNTSQPIAIRLASMESVRSIERRPRSTSSTIGSTRRRRSESNARCCIYGARAGPSTRSTSKMAARSASGGNGPGACTGRR